GRWLHHPGVHGAPDVVRRAPHRALGQRRPVRPGQLRPALRAAPHLGPRAQPHRGRHRPRRPLVAQMTPPRTRPHGSGHRHARWAAGVRETNGSPELDVLTGHAERGRPVGVRWPVREYGSIDTVSRMKTTIDIPDALAEEAKAVARRSGATLRELVVAGLRAEVSRRETSTPVDFHFPTAGGDGLAAEVAPEDAVARS